MKLKDGVPLEILKKFGFEELDLNYKFEYGIFEDDPMFYMNGYVFNIGYSRRGQSYYLHIEEDGEFMLYASRPDGDGGNVIIGSIFNELFNNNLIE